MTTRAWVLSGGASKGAFSAGVVQGILESDQNIDFKYAIGTSTGSLVGGPALLRDLDYLANAYTTMANSDILNNTLIGSILGTPLGASMEPLHRQLRTYYLDHHRLDDLIGSGKILIVTTVNVRTGQVHLISSEMVRNNQIAPATFVKAILASCSVPVFTKPVAVFEDETSSKYRHDLFYDGGVKEFLPFEQAVKLGVDEAWGVSTHRLESAETDWGGSGKADQVGILDALKWTVSTLLDEVARGDRFRADIYFRYSKGIASLKTVAAGLGLDNAQIESLVEPLGQIPPLGHGLKKLYLIYPTRRMDSSLDFNERIMMGYLREGRRVARRFIDAGKPEFSDGTLADWDHQVD